MCQPIPEEIKVVQLIYQLYSNPQTSSWDIMKCLNANGIKNRDGKNFNHKRIREIVTNPLYVRADAAIFEFFRGQGTEIVNDVEQFIGVNGAYLYTGRDAKKRKTLTLQGQVLVLAPHEGCIESDVWLACRRKTLNIKQIAKPVKAKNTWLAGKVKCRKCDYALNVNVQARKHVETARYFTCNTKYYSNSCDGVGCIRVEKIEDIVYDEIRRKLQEFQSLSCKERQGDSIEVTKLKIRVDEIDQEIGIFLDRMISASATTMEYINKRIEALDEEKRSATEKLSGSSRKVEG